MGCETRVQAGDMLRQSLKRGLARQAMAEADRDQAEAALVLAELAGLRPNGKSLQRVARRLGRLAGVVRVAALAGQGLVVVLRNRREVTTRSGGTDIFGEPSLVYSLVTATAGGARQRITLHRAAIGPHALERFVERGDVALEARFLPQVDRAAARLLRAFARDAVIEEDGDQAISAGPAGLWAGSADLASVEDGWPAAAHAGGPVPIFSARTFLSPEVMRPMLWLKWSQTAGG
jgi:hypothetical protein